jgi:predicted membrane-bound spermidine synthase
MWISCLLAFIGSACTLVIELIAGRIMAPYIGVSLYTWTSVIGVVLAGMSVGNFAGGVVADRFASWRALAVIFIAGSVACVGILVVTQAIVGVTFGVSFLPRIVLSIAVIFFLPSFVLGMVSPMVVKLALANLEHSGHTVGTIYASSTVGSIVGTFVTGFWLISWIGTRRIVWLVAIILLLT